MLCTFTFQFGRFLSSSKSKNILPLVPFTFQFGRFLSKAVTSFNLAVDKFTFQFGRFLSSPSSIGFDPSFSVYIPIWKILIRTN
jgi:hypothetical protein